MYLYQYIYFETSKQIFIIYVMKQFNIYIFTLLH